MWITSVGNRFQCKYLLISTKCPNQYIYHILRFPQNILKTYLDKYKKSQQQLQASRTIEQNWSLLQSCISLLKYLGDFGEQLAHLEQRIVILVLEKHSTINSTLSSASNPIGYRIFGKRELNELQSLFDVASKADEDGLGTVFKAARDQITSICEYTHDTTLASVFAPIEVHLKTMDASEALTASSGGDLPDFSFAPQEFITQVSFFQYY